MNTSKEPTRHPMQPLELNADGVLGFKENRLIRWLAKNVPGGLNSIPYDMFDQAELDQFAQLIGYTHAGFEELSYTSDEAYEVSEIMFRQNLDEKEARRIYQERVQARLFALLDQKPDQVTIEVHIKGYRQQGKTFAADLISKTLSDAGYTNVQLVSQDKDFLNKHNIGFDPSSHPIEPDRIKFVIVDNNEIPSLKGSK